MCGNSLAGFVSFSQGKTEIVCIPFSQGKLPTSLGMIASVFSSVGFNAGFTSSFFGSFSFYRQHFQGYFLSLFPCFSFLSFPSLSLFFSAFFFTFFFRSQHLVEHVAHFLVYFGNGYLGKIVERGTDRGMSQTLADYLYRLAPFQHQSGEGMAHHVGGKRDRQPCEFTYLQGLLVDAVQGGLFTKMFTDRPFIQIYLSFRVTLFFRVHLSPLASV